MTRDEARQILSVYRPGTDDATDPFFADALKLAASDPELAQWLAAEQAFDSALVQNLAQEPAPFGLETRLLAAAREPARKSSFGNWVRAIALAGGAACATLLVTVHMMDNAESRHNLANFRGEMVSFIQMDPQLSTKTGDLQEIRSTVAENTKLTDIDFPKGVMQLPALGCRSFYFRGYKVALVCFMRPDHQLAHVFIIDRKAFAAAEMAAGPHMKKMGDWNTAMWANGDMVYLLATQADDKTVEGLL